MLPIRNPSSSPLNSLLFSTALAGGSFLLVVAAWNNLADPLWWRVVPLAMVASGFLHYRMVRVLLRLANAIIVQPNKGS